MLVSEQMTQSIMKNGASIDIADHAAREGVAALRRSGLKKARAELTSLEDVGSVINE